MLNPFLLTAVFYLVVALLVVVDAALTGYSLLPWFTGLPWLRAHMLTLGVLAQATFGVLPRLAAGKRGVAAPATRWDIWLLLNAGLVLLIAGIPAITSSLIIAGGTLVFIAATLLMVQVGRLGGGTQSAGSGSTKFYVSGIVYLLVGILIGTGLWVGWSEPLRIGVPKEAHVHANSWGFASLVLAGLLVDMLPALTGKPLASRRTVDAIFWSMTVGALGLVLGPWLGGNLWVTVPGLVLHIVATVWLIVVAVRGLRGAGLFAQPGAWHLTVSYTWILLPIAMAPFVVFKLPGLPGADIEAIAPQALIYGWMGQFLLAALPWFVARWLLRDKQARLGGSWLSLITVNAGSVLIWAGIFAMAYRGLLHGSAWMLYGVALAAALWEAGRMTLAALRRAEGGAEGALASAAD